MLTMFYILRTKNDYNKKRFEWRVLLSPEPVAAHNLALPNVLHSLFINTPVFTDKSSAKKYCRKLVKDLTIGKYYIIDLKRDFIICSYSDLEDIINPTAHKCGDCNKNPAISYNIDTYSWTVSCKNITCINGFLTCENSLHEAVNKWNEKQQTRAYQKWLEEKDGRDES